MIKIPATEFKIKRKLLINEYHIASKYEDFYKKISRNERRILGLYKGNGYKLINKYLLGQSIDEIKESQLKNFENYIKSLSNIDKNIINLVDIKKISMQKFIELYVNKIVIEPINILTNLFKNKHINKLSNKDVLYRGLRICFMEKYNIGDDVIFKNFSSTSKDLNTALMFAGGWSQQEPCLCVISKCKNLPFIYLPWKVADMENREFNVLTSNTKNTEFELLLPRNLKLKLVKKTIEHIPIYKSSTYLELKNSLKLANLKKQIKNTSKNKSNKSNKKHNNLEIIFKKIPIYYLEFKEVIETEPICKWTISEPMSLLINQYNNKF